MKNKCLLLLLFTLFFSCNNQPTCSDPAVKDLVFEIVLEDYQKVLEGDYFNTHYSYGDVRAYAKDNNLDINELDAEVEQTIRSEAKSFAYEQSSRANTSLNGIRLIDKNEEIKKCDCAAELILNGEETRVEYTAQYTEDDQIYVELYHYNQ